MSDIGQLRLTYLQNLGLISIILKLSAILAIAGFLLIAITVNNAFSQTAGIYEDQFVLCNHELVCFTFNQDDYLSNSQIEEFQLFFDNNMDTYYIEELHD